MGLLIVLRLLELMESPDEDERRLGWGIAIGICAAVILVLVTCVLMGWIR